MNTRSTLPSFRRTLSFDSMPIADTWEQDRQVLMRLTGIGEVMAKRLESLGSPLDAFILITAFPLVVVAWADGAVDPAEAAMIIEFCERRGLARDGEGRKLLERWLRHGPTARTHVLFAGFVAEHVRSVSAVAYERWRMAVLEGARAVAEAAGGFLFLIPKVNAAERAALARLEVSLDPARSV